MCPISLKIINHLYLVSSQTTANITPCLDTAISPDKVFLLVCSEMVHHAELLSSVLKQAAGVQVQFWMIDDAWDVEQIMTRTMELLEQYQDQTFALNATGGTRAMSIGAFQVFYEYEKPVFCIHPEDDRLIWLYPRDQMAHQLADRVRLRHFLLVHGSTVMSRERAHIQPVYREFAENLIAYLDYFDRPVATLNWYACNSLDGASLELSVEQQRWDALLDLLDRLQQLNLVKYTSGRLVFRSDAARKFVSGGWLEHYVYAELLQVRQQLPEIQDIAQNLKITRESKGQTIHNELDVAFLCNNHFHVVECKTRQMSQHSTQTGSDVLYKLDTLKALLGGLSGQGMLVSYKSMSASDKHRAADLGIEICDGLHLRDLRSRLVQWLRKTNSL